MDCSRCTVVFFSRRIAPEEIFRRLPEEIGQAQSVKRASDSSGCEASGRAAQVIDFASQPPSLDQEVVVWKVGRSPSTLFYPIAGLLLWSACTVQSIGYVCQTSILSLCLAGSSIQTAGIGLFVRAILSESVEGMSKKRWYWKRYLSRSRARQC
jgi:hypothetical protein